MIIDFAKIYVKAGDGGQGASSQLMFSARKIVGGGGNGGRGGDVVLQISPHLYDLHNFKENRKFVAEQGKKGEHNNRTGKGGKDIIVNVPQGTRVLDLGENLIVDLDQPEQEFIICQGGKGGEGNYKKIYCIEPQPGEEKDVILDFRVCADVAIVGFANSGKTSLINILASRNFKVAEYPFTTTYCQWTKTHINGKPIAILDLPPLKKNAKARGYINSFLKHLLRVKIVIFLSDNETQFKDDFKGIKKEIIDFSRDILKGKEIFYVVSKVDLMSSKPKGKNILALSVKDVVGIEKFKQKIIDTL